MSAIAQQNNKTTKQQNSSPSLSSSSSLLPLLGDASTCDPSLKIHVVPAGLAAMQTGCDSGY